MRAGTQVPVYGAGCQEWLLELPREGTFADVAEQIPEARDFQLRPDDGGDEKIAIPLDLSLYDLRLYLADGYHLYVEVHPAVMAFQVNGGPVQTMSITPSTSIEDFLRHNCHDTVTVDSEANCVFPAASVHLLHKLGMATSDRPLQLKVCHPLLQHLQTEPHRRRAALSHEHQVLLQDSAVPGRRWSRGSVWRSIRKTISFDSLGSRLGSMASTLSGIRRPMQTPAQPSPPE